MRLTRYHQSGRKYLKMWREAILKLHEGFSPVNCSVVAAHPWVYGLGQQTDNGAYLSPANAVAWLAEKLASATGEMDVVVLMATGATHGDFLSALDLLVNVFPAPAFTQVKRLAESAAQLAVEKMQKPAKPINGLPAAIPLSVPTARTVTSAAASAALPEVSSMATLKASLAAFASQRDGMLASIADGAGEIVGKEARAWVFTSSGNAAGIVRNLVADIPSLSSVYSAAMMMVGSDLSSIRGMIHDFDSNAGA